MVIRNVDHNPPHCHVIGGGGRDLKVSIETLEVLAPASATLSPSLRKCLREDQAKMLEAWEQVLIMGSGTE